MYKLTAIFVSLSMCGMVMADCSTMYKNNAPNPDVTHTVCLPKSSNVIQTLTPTEAQKTEIVDKHNGLRKQADATNMLQMSWNDELAEIAERWAEQCTDGHDSAEGRAILAENPMGIVQKRFSVGQNAFRGTYQATWSDIVAYWHSEIANFKYGVGNIYPPEAKKYIGHYTQVVWANTFMVGCSMTKCQDGWYTAVCNYGPAGNSGDMGYPYEKGTSCECNTCEDGLCVCDKLCWAGNKNVKSCACECRYPELAWVNATDCSYDCDVAPAAGGACGWSNLQDNCYFINVKAECPKDCGICP